jgi:hypothetical protein
MADRLRRARYVDLDGAIPAARLRVRPADPRLGPKRGPVRRRAVPPDEIRAFTAQVSPSQRGCGWAPLMTECPSAMHADDLIDTVERAGAPAFAAKRTRADVTRMSVAYGQT